MSHPAKDNLPPIHPGEILADDLAALGMSARSFASHIHVPANAITAIMKGDRGITAEMAMRLARALGTTEQYWLNLQAHYEAKIARQKIGDKLATISRLVPA